MAELSVAEVKKLVVDKEMEMGEDLFEYHALNTDSIRDIILGDFKNHLTEKEYNDVVEEDMEMFELRNLHYSIDSLFDISEERKQELENAFYTSFTNLLNKDEGLKSTFFDKLEAK